MTTPETLWNVLVKEATGRPFKGLLIRRYHPESSRDLFLGLEEPGDHRAFILQVSRQHLPAPSAFPETQGLDMRIVSLPGETDAKGSLLLVLKEDRYADVFQALVHDLAETLASTETDEDAVNVFLGRIRKWQRFLEVSQGDGLGDEAQRGLFGELWFLRERVFPTVGPSGVYFWTGCERTPQDFQVPGGAIEVKTTLKAHHPILKIHGARQLDETLISRLLLCHLTLENTLAEGETLSAMVHSVRKHLEGKQPYAEHFETHLLEAGYHDRHISRYDTVAYSVRQAEQYEVIGDFPRLRFCDLKSGIRDVAYSIDVAACRNHRVSLEEIAILLAAG